jgi:hypothetical protein
MYRIVWGKKWSLIIGTLCIVYTCFLSACGGGGGGGSDAAGLSYSGLEAPAEITAGNAQEIASSAYSLGSTGVALTGIAALKDNEQTEMEAGRPFLVDVTGVFIDVVEEIDFSEDANNNQTAAFISESGSIPGGCGGSTFYSITLDDVSGEFSGRLTFQAFCSEEITINGPASFSGIIDMATGELEAFHLGIGSITGISGSESYTMEGDMDFDISSVPAVMVMDMLMRDDNLGKIYRLENCQMEITEYSDHLGVEISGRVYDPDYGYVNLTMPSPFLIGLYDDNPYSGQLLLTGENGSVGGPASIRLTAISATQCQVEADINGDGSYDGPPEDYDSGIILWSAFF